jgi:tetratricopeptide (TPR) repeat protein
VRKRLREGIALQKGGRLLEAARVYSEIVQRDPSNADALHLLGTIEIARQNLDNALELIRKALKLNSKNAIYHHNLAYIHGARGEAAAAEAHYRRAIALKPDYAEAYFNLSGSARFKAGDSAIAPLETLLGSRDLSRADRIFAEFAAGKIFDDLGLYDRAFAHYRRGNAARAAAANPAYGRALIEALIATFDGALLERLSGGGAHSELPVFIVGMPRSGTTLVEQILASHPRVHGAGELPDIDAIAKELPRFAAAPGGQRAGYPACLAAVEPKLLRGLAEAYVRRLEGLAPAATRVVDKAPLNVRHLGLIALMFPKAKVIHCRRDPLDTCLSCYFQNFLRGQEYSFDLGELGRFHGDYRRLMAHWRAILPLPVFELSYEALVSEQERVSRDLLAFCGLDWDPACAAFHQTERSVGTASRWQVRQPIYHHSIGRWRHYQHHLAPLIDALGPYADEAG